MNKNETLIRKIAEEMAAEKHPVSFQLFNKYKDQADNGWSHAFYVANWPVIIDRFIDQARIAVKHMAEAFKQSYYIWCQNKENMTIDDREYLNSYLIEHGLIPEIEKEAKND